MKKIKDLLMRVELVMRVAQWLEPKVKPLLQGLTPIRIAILIMSVLVVLAATDLWTTTGG